MRRVCVCLWLVMVVGCAAPRLQFPIGLYGPPPEAFAAEYAGYVARLREQRAGWITETRAMEEWGGWKWTPAGDELDAVAGLYRHPAYGVLDLSVRDGQLVGRLNGMGMTLEPARPGLFGAVLDTDFELEALEVVGENVTFLGETFQRQTAE